MGNLLRDAIYGLAVGDALGVPAEFQGCDSYRIDGMVGGGAHGKRAGTFSDDTSMALATCDSIRACGGVDVDDMRERFRAWLRDGDYAVDGDVFDVGMTVSRALTLGRGLDGERDNGRRSRSARWRRSTSATTPTRWELWRARSPASSTATTPSR